MATYAQLTADAGRQAQHLASDISLQADVYENAREIAALLGFPKETEELVLAQNSNELNLAGNVIRISSISNNGISVSEMSRQDLEFVKSITRPIPFSPAMGYRFTQASGNTKIIVAPRRLGGEDTDPNCQFVIEYVRNLTGITPNAPAWEGLYDTHHQLIAYRVVAKAYRRHGMIDYANYYIDLHDRMLVDLAMIIGEADYTKLLLGVGDDQKPDYRRRSNENEGRGARV